VNVPVVCAGTLVEPGDIVVGDDDGVVVLPRRIAADIVTAATAFLEGEKGFRAMLAEEYVSFGAIEQLKEHGYRLV
jgi:4-hydroxy-4-methyl-2-oxoglutarate aldolase